MASLKQFIVEIHRRSLWQVLTIYLGASWAVLEVSDQIVDRYLLPEWVYPAALILLLIGLPIVLATAFVREERREPERVADVRDPTLLGEVSDGAAGSFGGRAPKPIVKLLTWPRAILGGVLAFVALGTMSALIVVRGSARVTEAYGAAGDAFEEREWVVVTEFEAPEDEEDIALAVREALRVDLQQSQYVNLFGRDRVVQVLRRMGLPDTTRLDRGLALDVAEREGLAAVLVGRVARLGEDYSFSAWVIQPGTRDELIAVRTAARADRLLDGVGALSREVRSRLGEERASIKRSRPLPEVTTRSLDALKIYARAVDALQLEDDNIRSAELAVEATRVDSTFAMAHRLAAVGLRNQGRAGDAVPHATRAFELRDRLTDRERLHVEAYYHQVVSNDVRSAAEAYELVLAQYPDDHRAHNNLGVLRSGRMADYEGAYQSYLRAVEINPSLGLGYSNAVSMAIKTGRWEAADSLVHLAEERGFSTAVEIWPVGQAYALGELEQADSLCDELLAGAHGASSLALNRTSCGSIDVARGRLRQGVERLGASTAAYAEGRLYRRIPWSVGPLMLAEQMRNRPGAAGNHLESVLDRFDVDSISERDRVALRSLLRIWAGVLGRVDLLADIEATYPPAAEGSNWIGRLNESIGDGSAALARGDPRRAIEALNSLAAIDYELEIFEGPIDLIYALAYDELGLADSAVHHLESFVRPTQMAAWWHSFDQANLPFALLRLAELQEAREEAKAAVEHYQRLLDLWSAPDPELRDRVTSVQRALARLTGSES